MPTKAEGEVRNQATKKRRRSSGQAGVSGSQKKKSAQVSQATPPPTHTLIIDNGGDTLKYGWSTDTEPRFLPNVTARLAHQITLLVGDQLSTVQNPSSLVAVTRNMERGLISDMGNQVQVWKRLLDLLGVSIPLDKEAAHSLGWKVKAARSHKTKQGPNRTIPSQSIAVVLLIPPHCPRLLMDQILYVWMEDFGVAHVGFGNSTILASHEHNNYGTSCTVDLGWSSGLVVPTFRKKPISSTAIRRLPIGGRHLINILKYYASYRQYNLMDQEHILRDVLEKLAFFSMSFCDDLRVARLKSSGLRPYDRDYVLPDYETTFLGEVRLPPALKREAEEASKDHSSAQKQQEDEEDEEDFNFEEASEEEKDSDKEDSDAGVHNDPKHKLHIGEEVDSDSSVDDGIEARLVQERSELQQRLRDEAREEQLLRVSVERFTVPEVLFRPSDAGLPMGLMGLAHTILEAIRACPPHYQPALYSSIRLVGGLSQIPNLQPRLYRELRALVPDEYDVEISLSADPRSQAWYGAKSWIGKTPHPSWSVSRSEWLERSKRRVYGRLLLADGGSCV